MTISIVRLGTLRLPDEGLRIGTVRRPPRGVPKAEFASRDYYDVWLPALSPSPELVTEALSAQGSGNEADWKRFTRRFRSEIQHSDAHRTLDVLAALSHSTNLSVGCYCEDEHHCHRSILREMLIERGALVR